MVYLEINKKNQHKLIDKLNAYLSNKQAKVFILFYMEGCGPCNQTRPEWAKLKNILSNDKKDIVVVSIDKDLHGKLKHAGREPMSFPTIRFMTDAGEKIETYEDSEVTDKDRSIDSFVEWIKLKTGDDNVTKLEGGGKKTLKRRKTRRQSGGKWSIKYKRKINCRKPRGFSQKQYCKYK